MSGMSTHTSPTRAEAGLRAGRDHLIRYAGEFPDFLVERADGSWLETEDGRRILDFTSGQMCSTLGHGHPAILEAMRGAGERAVHLFSGFISSDVTGLARELMALLPEPLARAMFLSTGGEANEAALRLAKLTTGGHEVLAFAGSWHGMTAGAAASTYSAGRRGYGPAIPGTMALPTPNPYRCPIAHCRDRCDLTCLDTGLALTDAQSVGGAGRGDRGADPQRRRHRAAARLTRRPQEALRGARDAARRRRGADGARQGRRRCPPSSSTTSCRTSSRCPRRSAAACRSRHELNDDGIEQDAFEKGFLHVTAHVSDPLPAAVGRA